MSAGADGTWGLPSNLGEELLGYLRDQPVEHRIVRGSCQLLSCTLGEVKSLL